MCVFALTLKQLKRRAAVSAANERPTVCDEYVGMIIILCMMIKSPETLSHWMIHVCLLAYYCLPSSSSSEAPPPVLQ